MRARVLMFVKQLHRFASQEADPGAVADALEPAFGLLPKDFRELMLGTSVEALIAGLARWLPQKAYLELTGFLTTHPNQKQWIAQFQAALRGEDEDLDDAGEEVATPESPTESLDFDDYIDPEAASSADRAAALFEETPDPFAGSPTPDPFAPPGPVGPGQNGPPFPPAPAAPQG